MHSGSENDKGEVHILNTPIKASGTEYLPTIIHLISGSTGTYSIFPP